MPKINLNVVEKDDTTGVFEMTPLVKGFGSSLGSALRRTLYSTAEGSAITKVSIDGVSHQFTTLEGATDDVMHILLNLKKVRFSKEIEGDVDLVLEATGPGDVTAGDIEEAAGVHVVNKDLVITNLSTKKNKIKMKLTVSSGRGYVPHDESETVPIGTLLLDANYSPVVNVSMLVEDTRVGRDSNYDKLTLTVKTDGSVDSEVILREAASVLKELFYRIESGEDYVAEMDDDMTDAVEEKTAVSSSHSSLSVDEVALEELHLPTRTINALRKAGIKTLGDLSDRSEDDLLRVRNLGEKSIREILALLEKENLR